MGFFSRLFGKEKSKVKTPTIIAPPQITQYDFASPTGDRYLSRREGNTQFSEAFLSPETGNSINTSKNALQDLADELYAPDMARVQDIGQRAADFYDLLAGNINDEADNQLSRAASDLSKRFGGTYNATFGVDYLSRIQGNRMSRLSDAAKEAAMFAEDLYSRDETSRMERFKLFQNFLSTEYDKAYNAYEIGIPILQDEANRSTNLAVTRARLAQQAAISNQNTELARDKMRAEMITAAIKAAASAG